MTPEQRANLELLGRKDPNCASPDAIYRTPSTGELISWNDLVARYRMDDLRAEGFVQIAGHSIAAGCISATNISFGPIKVFPDGHIERTDSFTTTDAAAIAFWEAVERLMPLNREVAS